MYEDWLARVCLCKIIRSLNVATTTAAAAAADVV